MGFAVLNPSYGIAALLLIEPDVREILVQIMARADLPAFHVRPVGSAVEQFERSGLGAGLLQPALRLGARLVDIGPEPGDLVQLLVARRQRIAREDQAAGGMDIGDLRQCPGAVPAVDRQCQGAPHAYIVERLYLLVDRHDAAAVPIAVLKRDLIAERFP